MSSNLGLEPTEDVFSAMDGHQVVFREIGGQFDSQMTTEELQKIMQEYDFEFQ